jgi:iron complex transport system substrate-binding protein
MLHRMALVAIVIVALLAAGCQVAPPVTTAPVAETATAAPAAAADSAPATRLLTDAAGRAVEVPANPARIVTLTELDLDSALALGVTPVGSVNGRGQLALPAYLADKSAGIESVGSLAEPSLEKIVALDPDLIIVGNPIPAIEELMEELQQIAPVYVAWSAGDDWKTAFTNIGAVLNREAEAEAFLADYSQRAAAIKAQLPADSVTEASVARWMPDGPVVMIPTTFSSLVLADVGLARPAAHVDIGGGHGAHSEVISLEKLDVIDADWLFIGTLNPDGAAALEAAKQNPLFRQLQAVQQDHVAAVDGTVWTSIGGPLAALAVLDDVERALTGGSEAGSAPDPAAAFPMTIEHKFGSTVIPQLPERIVTVGLTDQDALLALGVVPVGVTEWFGGYPGAIWPWAQDKLNGALPELVGDGETINFEKIASLQPDAIVALFAGLTEEDYQLLSQIAPTVAQPEGYIDWGIPWQEQTRILGQVVGQAERADELVAEVEAMFAQVQQEHPDFVGATAVAATPYQGIWVYGSQDIRGQLLSALGFVVPPAIDEAVGAAFGGNLSQERADLLDVDVIIWRDVADAEGELGGPLYQSLPVHTGGHEVFIDSYNDPLGGATSFVTVLSLPYLLEGLTPQLAAALAGNGQ